MNDTKHQHSMLAPSLMAEASNILTLMAVPAEEQATAMVMAAATALREGQPAAIKDAHQELADDMVALTVSCLGRAGASNSIIAVTLLAYACQVAKHSLTSSEWANVLGLAKARVQGMSIVKEGDANA